jgi:hypothetical protein
MRSLLFSLSKISSFAVSWQVAEKNFREPSGHNFWFKFSGRDSFSDDSVPEKSKIWVDFSSFSSENDNFDTKFLGLEDDRSAQDARPMLA